MSTIYEIPLVLKVQSEGKYIVTSPELPDLATAGDTVQEALTSAGDALGELLAEEARLGAIKQWYAIKHPPEVFTYLRNAPPVAQALVDAWPQLERYFQAAPQMVELRLEPDRETGTLELVAFIKTTMPAVEATDRLRDLDYSWFLSLPGEVLDKLNFDVEFV